MVQPFNLASKLCSLLLNGNSEESAYEWRILGQEQDGALLFSWLHSSKEKPAHTRIGLYENTKDTLKIIHTFTQPTNVIQASINSSRNILGYVIKETVEGETEQFVYRPFLVNDNNVICDLELPRSKQIMLQFLCHKQSPLSNKQQPQKLLVLIHKECVLQYQIKCEGVFGVENFSFESIVRVFIWAQWDPINQTLYYIHFRKPTRSLVEGEEVEADAGDKVTPTLSGLQFHDELPHETVLNIPLNLPHLSGLYSSCGTYEDDPVPLRIHNCSLDLMVLTHSNGYVCVCHHYLYQPINPPEELNESDTTPVHFAYSVTVLHHSCVLHCVVPKIPWNEAKLVRPFFKLYDDHMLVVIPGICVQLLDIGSMHEPSCHVTASPSYQTFTIDQTSLAPLYSFGNHSALNITTLDVINVTVPINHLAQTFKSSTTLENQLSILHYLLVHAGETEIVAQLVASQIEKPLSLGFPQLLREFLIGSSYAVVQRNLPPDAQQLTNLLPLTTKSAGTEEEIEIDGKQICLSQDALWNASMMLLSPQQRIVPYRSDIFVKLWDHLARFAKAKQKFKSSQVVEKLLVSLVCYQPEALSRSSTPMSPCGGLGTSTILNELVSAGQSNRKNQNESLPFHEIENCTASKQEHVISVNLRELSMHLLKQSTENKMNCFQWHSQTPIHVHAVATRYVSAQLEQSRHLCQILCKTATGEIKYDQDKGFMFIDQLSQEKQYILFTVLERYYLAAESIAFPFPQGFSSFFTFLAYRALRFDIFLQYVQRNVLELQVDVMKIIMADIDDDREGVGKKLQLLTLLPKTRAKRLLNQWSHPFSLMLRAREHAVNVLSGTESAGTRSSQKLQKSRSHKLGIAAFPSADRLSPLDTFFDLLTAKASLTDLDFGLLIEATVYSTEEFI